jgi:hypothetical protein
MLTGGMLAAMGMALARREFHRRLALNTRVVSEVIVEIFLHGSVYASRTVCINAIVVAKMGIM